MDSERARALRDLLGGSDWVQRTREVAVTLRISTTSRDWPVGPSCRRRWFGGPRH
jgi:hypothetical protein